MTAPVSEWLLLHSHLRGVIDTAKEQKLCPPGWGSYWGQGICEHLLTQRPLEQWLKVTPKMIDLSRGVYYPLKKSGGASTGWKPWHIPESEVDEDQWEQQRREQEQEQERERQEKLVREANG